MKIFLDLPFSLNTAGEVPMTERNVIVCCSVSSKHKLEIERKSCLSELRFVGKVFLFIMPEQLRRKSFQFFLKAFSVSRMLLSVSKAFRCRGLRYQLISFQSFLLSRK